MGKRWKYDEIKKEALRFSSRIEWQKKSKASYLAAYRRKIHNSEDISGHMNRQILCWDYDSIKKDALRFNSKANWRAGSPKGYKAAVYRNLCQNKEVVGHMASYKKPNGFWHNIDNLKESALRYKTLSEWQKFEGGAYNYALEKGLVKDDRIVGHMVCGIEFRRGFGRKRLETIFYEEFILSLYSNENIVRDRKLPNLPYRPDFLINNKIIIEFDENSHNHKGLGKQNDIERQSILEENGFTVIRFSESWFMRFLDKNNKKYLLDR